MTSSLNDALSASNTLAVAQALALPVGTRLSEYEVRGVLGCGGFGIVYLAWDHGLQREVAIKEYMPAMLAGRGADHHVSVRSNATASTFALGLKSFVNEARLLAQFNHPSLVKVHRFWEANDTAYMVMPRYRGRTLRQVRSGMSEPPGDVACRHVLRALMAALDVLHRDDVFHRDIAPDNILLCEDSTPVLLDFGAARRVIGEGQQALTSILKPHYAPLEQYADQRSMRQGPWTDLYALGATLYYFATGEEPVAAASRALQDDQPRLLDLQLPGFTPQLASVVDWMLELKPVHRPQSVQAVREVMDGHAEVPTPPEGTRTPRAEAASSGAESGSVHRTDIDLTASSSPDSHTVVLTGNPQLTSSPMGQLAVVADSPVAQGVMGDPVLGPTIINTASNPPPASAPARSNGRNGVILLALVAVNVMAWWWFTRPSTPTSMPSAVAAAAPASSQLAVAAPGLPAPSALSASSASVDLAMETASAVPVMADAASQPAAQPKLPEEVILSVMPARATPPVAASAAVPSPAKPARSETVAATSTNTATDSNAPARSQPVAPAITTPAPALDPRERCGDRMFIAMSICIKRECDKDASLRNHPECVRMREIEEAQRNPGN